MGTQKAPLTLVVGGPFSASGFFRTKSTGAVEDIESWLFKGGTKDDIDDAEEFKAFTITPFQNTDDNDNWWVQIDMSTADVLAHQTAGIFDGAWDFWYSDDDGSNYFKFARGSFTVEKKVSKLT